VSVSYTYDRFGRVTQDGALTSTYDKNGNRLTVGYPSSVSALYTYDFADRPSTLQFQDGANPAQTLVNAATYKPYGPLTDLTLGNGTFESRSFDARYFPAGIAVPGLFDWTYSTDSMGNVTAIDDNLNAANDRAYGYLDHNYFLTTGNGPWGARSWTYDKIGNRLTEGADAYTYTLNGAANNTPKLSSIALGLGGSRAFTYDNIGDTTGIGGVTLAYNSGRRLRQIGTDLTFLYDGRDFLRQSSKVPGGGGAADTVTPTYSSDGLFHHRRDVRNAGALQSDYYVFHFAGRPLASLEKIVNGGVPSSSLLYLTTDHLGTPVLAADNAGAKTWEGGFEPFGKDYAGAQAAGVPLRFPGQWQDANWYGYSGQFDLSYNVHRWYEGQTGRYTRPDPIRSPLAYSDYLYVSSNPLTKTDRLGLFQDVIQQLSFEHACAIEWGLEGQRRGRARGFRYAHCWTSCMIDKNCGRRAARLAEIEKELLDLVKCSGEVIARNAPPDGNCWSAFQPSDFEDNAFGRECPPKISCDQHCDPIPDKLSAPGPLWPPVAIRVPL
jgi:RHS repeat-associated protein